MPEITLHIRFGSEAGKLELQSLAQSLTRAVKYMVENDAIGAALDPKVTNEVSK